MYLVAFFESTDLFFYPCCQNGLHKCQYKYVFLANAFFLSKASAKLQTILYSTKFFCQSNSYLRFCNGH